MVGKQGVGSGARACVGRRWAGALVRTAAPVVREGGPRVVWLLEGGWKSWLRHAYIFPCLGWHGVFSGCHWPFRAETPRAQLPAHRPCPQLILGQARYQRHRTLIVTLAKIAYILHPGGVSAALLPCRGACVHVSATRFELGSPSVALMQLLPDRSHPLAVGNSS